MLTTNQAANHLGIAPAYLRSLLAAGKGPASIREGGKGPGGAHRFTIETLDQWQNSRTRLVRAPVAA